MPRRYDNEKTSVRFDGKRIYKSVIYPNIAEKDTDIYITAKASDRLDLLADTYYEDKNDWWIIAVASNLNQGTLHVEAGTQLRIPQEIDDIIKEYNSLNP